MASDWRTAKKCSYLLFINLNYIKQIECDVLILALFAPIENTYIILFKRTRALLSIPQSYYNCQCVPYSLHKFLLEFPMLHKFLCLMFTECYWKIKISKGNVIGMIKIGQNCHRLNMNNLIFFLFSHPGGLPKKLIF